MTGMLTLDTIKSQIAALDDIHHFFEVCNQGAKSTQPWQFSLSDSEKSFDIFMQQLTEIGKQTALRFSAIFARYAVDYIRDQHLDEVRGIGFAFLENDPCLDGQSIERQIQNVERWLENPTPEHKAGVKEGIDPSRQLEIWEEDLFPSEDQMWLWIIENTHLLSLGVTAGDAETYDHDSEATPYRWSAKACIARSAVSSLKVIAQEERTVDADLTTLFRRVGVEWK